MMVKIRFVKILEVSQVRTLKIVFIEIKNLKVTLNDTNYFPSHQNIDRPRQCGKYICHAKSQMANEESDGNRMSKLQ